MTDSWCVCLITSNDHEPLIAHPGSYDADRCIHRNDHGQPRGRVAPAGKEAAVLAVVVTIAKGYDLGYIWKTQDHATPSAPPAATTSTPPRPGNHPAAGGDPAPRPSASPPARSSNASPTTRSTGRLDPRTGAKLGRPRGRYPTFADHLARLKAAEPHATAERLIELEREAAQATRQPAAYYRRHRLVLQVDLGAARLDPGERAPRPPGRRPARRLAYWAGREESVPGDPAPGQPGRAGVPAGLGRDHPHRLSRHPGRRPRAGPVRGRRADRDLVAAGHQPGRRSRRITFTIRSPGSPGPFRDGKWRALDTMSVRAVLGALQAVAATAVECELTREFGVAWVPRADGRGNEIRGVTQAQMDAYSTRTVQVREKERELARAWERKHGRAPTSRELLHIANAATLQSRKGKDAGAIDWDALARAVGRHPRRRPGRDRARGVERARPRRAGARASRAAGRRPDRPRARPRPGRWPRPWSWCRTSIRPGPGTTCSSSSPW